MENHFIDPFNIFKLPYEFEINNLDEIYYSLYKTNQKLVLINSAYKILKNEVKRLFFLCKFYNQTKSDPQILLFIMQTLKSNNFSEKNLNYFLEQSIEFAKQRNWKESWKALQKYQYIKRIIKQKSV